MTTDSADSRHAPPASCLSTGLELELLLPQGLDRLGLCERLRPVVGGRVEAFEFPSKVPVPHSAGAGLDAEQAAAAVLAAMQDVARHHGARLHSIRPDGQYFFLSHRCGRLLDDAGACLLSVVHDNTIAGGERVAEVVTPPFGLEELPQVRALVEALAALPGIAIPRRGALHVHVDAGRLQDAEAVARLVDLYARLEARLRRWLRTPDGLRSGQPLPRGLWPALQQAVGLPWAQARPLLAAQVRDNRAGLNLYNVLHDVERKRTVELKLAAASLDPTWVLAVRELFVRLVLLAGDRARDLPRADAELLQGIDPAGDLRRVFERDQAQP